MTRLQCTDKKKNLKLLLTLFHATSPFVSASIPFISATILQSPFVFASTQFISTHYSVVYPLLLHSSPLLFRHLRPTIPSPPPHYFVVSAPLYLYFIVSSPFFRRFCLYYNFLRHYSVVSSFPPFGLLFRLLHMFKGAGTSAAFLLVPPWFTATGIKVVGGGGL